ncbi:MAG: AMP-binding protein [Burkholderiaceae bacterium]|nr:AMP-binding protein [Burkholderiaceae bacterium]
MAQKKLMLDYLYDHEAKLADHVYMTQPIGGGQVIDYTWGQTMDQARRMAAHLQSRGFEPGSRIAILSKNCAHFFMAEIAIWMAGYTTVAIFPTETSETVNFVLDHSGASLLFVGKLDTWDQQESGVPAGLPRIAFPLAPKTKIEGWDAIIERTPPLKGHPKRQPDDLAMFIYTSGSTGQPKGVMHSFGRISESCEGICKDIESRIGANVEIRALSYLPLAHVFERAWVEGMSMVSGKAHIFFAETLDTFVKDLNRARPTVFISVPRLWLKFQHGVFAKMPPKKLDRLLSIPILGRIVGRKVLKGLGLDEARLAGSGSAPIPAELISWYRRLGLNLIEGYAMTEDFAYSHNSTDQINAPGCVGVPLPGVQVRISEEGEILIKSPGQMVGYYKRPDLTAESITEDGFFRTGDRGERRADGLLKITGRVKELFKTSKGKYVAPAPIENMLNAHPMVELSLVSGVGQPSAYAMVLLNEELRPKAKEVAVRTQVEQELSQLLKSVNQKVADYESLKMIVIADEPWTIENGFLTPTMKIRRARIESAVEAKLPEWYAKKGAVHWM